MPVVLLEIRESLDGMELRETRAGQVCLDPKDLPDLLEAMEIPAHLDLPELLVKMESLEAADVQDVVEAQDNKDLPALLVPVDLLVMMDSLDQPDLLDPLDLLDPPATDQYIHLSQAGTRDQTHTNMMSQRAVWPCTRTSTESGKPSSV